MAKKSLFLVLVFHYKFLYLSAYFRPINTFMIVHWIILRRTHVPKNGLPYICKHNLSYKNASIIVIKTARMMF